MIVLFLILVCLIGVSTPVQTAINSRLQDSIGSPLVASLVQFGVGLLAISFISVIFFPPLWEVVSFTGPWYAWIGGLTGVIGLTLFIVLFPRIGGIQTVLLPIVGQLLTGVLIDHFGAFGMEPRPVSLVKAGGLILSLAGVAFVVIHKGEKTTRVKSKWVWQFLGIVAGAMIATQSAANGMLGGIVGSSITAALVSFKISTIVLVVLAFALKSSRDCLDRIVSVRRPLWHWSGGLIGVVIVTGYAFFAPILGVGLMSVVSILGQLVMSVVIDRFGLFGARKVQVGALQYFGIVLVFLGSVLIYQ
ncbi:MAG: DMT family transporter [Bacteroidales bacterium]|nr:DMT family transporter [Bacteroidales bacterium]